MKRFIKRNVVLVAVLSVAVIGTVFMMVYAVSSYIEMNNAINRTENLNQQIDALSKQKPAPSQENIDVIRRDAELYKKEAAKIQRYFGQPYAEALDVFYDKLGLYAAAEAAWKKAHSEDEEPPTLTPEIKADLQAQARTAFYDYFKEFWSARHEEALNNASIFRAFRNSRMKKAVTAEDEEEDDSGFPYYWTPEQWDVAMDDFGKAADAKSREPITADNREDIFFMALGLPRDFGGSPNKAALYIKDVQRRLGKTFSENNIFVDDEASYFSFVDVVPAKEQIAYVAKVVGIIDDLGARIAAAKPVKDEKNKEKKSDAATAEDTASAEEPPKPQEPLLTELWEFARVDLTEQESDAFEVFRFRVKVLGSLESVHALVKRLNDAAEADNRFYIVRRMTMQQLNDDARDIMLDAGLINEEDLTAKASGSNSMTAGAMFNMGGPTRPTVSTRPKTTARTNTPATRPGANFNMPGMPGMQEGTEKVTRLKNLRHSKLVGQQNKDGSGMTTRRPSVFNPNMPNNMTNMNNRYDASNYMQQNVMSEEEKKYWREQEDRLKPMHERSTYGQPMIGADIDLEVELIIDYVVLSNKDFEQE